MYFGGIKIKWSSLQLFTHVLVKKQVKVAVNLKKYQS